MSRIKTVTLPQLGAIPIVIKTKRDISDETPRDKRDDESLGWGYWDRLWPSEVALSEFLIQKFFPKKLKGQKVLEIGCGVGIAGVVAAQLGAFTTFSDMVPVTLEGVKATCQLNNLKNFETHILDWSAHIDLKPEYDVVLGSEVFFDTENLAGISHVLRHTLKPDGEGIFCDPNRLGLDTIEQHFQKTFTFSLGTIDLNWPPKKGTDLPKKSAYLYHLARKP